MAKTKHFNDDFKRIKRVEKNVRHNYKTELKKLAEYVTEEFDDEYDVEQQDSVYSGERSKS